MRTLSEDSRERRKITQLAREYRRRGYEVTCDARIADANLRADLLVKKGDELIVIEVKSSDSLRTQKDSVSRLAELVAKIPGARFDLVLTNPRKPDAKTNSAKQ